jgi:glycerol-3-phosphate dehydrogenase (NAD(P)+)
MTDTPISVLGSGAFGTALAIALASGGRKVTLWGRDADAMAQMADSGYSGPRLPGHVFPDALTPTASIAAACAAPVLLLAVPMQSLGALLADNEALIADRTLVACCKGIDLETLEGPTALIRRHCPDATAAILTGPGFAAEVAAGKPTAMTLATDAPDPAGPALQDLLSTDTIRLYLGRDPVGAEIGGALKNVIAIACGAAIGTGLGDSARAAVMTRGYAEMVRFATARGAQAETLTGLSGLGDLALTAMSDQSRNTRAGLALGRGEAVDYGATTVEGAATARAVADIAKRDGIDMPLTGLVCDLTEGRLTARDALRAIMARPLKEE